MTDDCILFLEEIRRNVAFLLDDWGFEIAHREQRRGSEHCLVVLRSPDFLLKFESHVGSPEIKAAVSSAPVAWANTGEGIRYWFGLEGIIDYLDNRQRTPEEISQLGETFWKMSRDQYLAYIAQQVQPLRNRLIQLFREDAFESRRKDMEQFLGA